jgi:molybdopterin-guanine dinucleotide biosynthesis protein A
MRLLGAILAGGQSRRFGADKAQAQIDGRAMLDVVADQLRPQCDGLVVIGRDWPGLPSATDIPATGLGPLGGIAGALAYGKANGFDDVLICPCDMPDLPENLAALLCPAPAYIEEHWGWSRWPTRLGDALAQWLRDGQSLRLRDWHEQQHARPVRIGHVVRNINEPRDF